MAALARITASAINSAGYLTVFITCFAAQFRPLRVSIEAGEVQLALIPLVVKGSQYAPPTAMKAINLPARFRLSGGKIWE